MLDRTLISTSWIWIDDYDPLDYHENSQHHCLGEVPTQEVATLADDVPEWA